MSWDIGMPSENVIIHYIGSRVIGKCWKVEFLGLTLMSFLSSVEWILMPDWLVEVSEFMSK